MPRTEWKEKYLQGKRKTTSDVSTGKAIYFWSAEKKEEERFGLGSLRNASI